MKSAFTRIAWISFLLVLFIPDLTSAETKTFIKEYTYQASEADSKLSSKSIALREVKRLLLEELGTYLESVTEIQNFQLTKDQIFTLTAGIVQTEIMDEKWDGHSCWLRARVAADSSEVIKSIDALRSDHEKTKELENVRKRSDEQLREIKRLRKELAAAKDENRAKKKAAYDDAINGLTAIEWFEKGYASGMSGNHSNAINALTKAMEIDPKVAVAYNSRGVAYGKLGNHRQAIEDFNKAIKFDPKHAGTYSNRGAAYRNLGNYRQAIKDFNKAIELNPQFAFAYINRGVAYGKIGNYTQAIEDFNKAIEFNPQFAFAYVNRGVAYGKIGNHRQKIEDFNMAIELGPNDAITYFYRAVAYAEFGNDRQAIQDYKTAAKLGLKKAQDFLISKGIDW